MAAEMLNNALAPNSGAWKFTPENGGHPKEINTCTSTNKHTRDEQQYDNTVFKKPRVDEDTPATTTWTMPATETVLTKAAMAQECFGAEILDLSTAGKVVINEYCFAGYEWLKHIILPRTAVLKDGAFMRCQNLIRVTFVAGTGGDVTLGDSAFEDCIFLSKVENIPQKCKYGDATFKSCVSLTGTFVLGGPDQPELPPAIFYMCNNLKAITLLPGTISIGSAMCQYCYGFNEVFLPHTIQHIGDAAFSDCKNCTKVIFEYKPSFAADRVIFGKKAFCNCNSLETIENMPLSYKLGPGTFARCHALTGSFTVGGPLQPCVPEKIFYQCFNIHAVTFLNGTRTIGRGVCIACTTLSLLVIPKTVDTICEYAFEGCKSLKEVYGGEALRGVEKEAFGNCVQLLKVTFATQMPIVFGNSVFRQCTALTEFTVPIMTPTLPERMFFNCSNLKKVVLNAVLESIGSYCFYDCDHLESCNFDDATQLTTLGTSCFAYSGLHTLNLNSTSIQTIHDSAFLEMPNLTTLVLPEKLKTIGIQMCMGCRSLKKLVFPALLLEIPYMACAYCTSLARVRIEGSEKIAKKCFVGCSALKEIVVAGYGTFTSTHK